MSGLVDVDAFRRSLDGHCRPEVDLDHLTVTYVKLRRGGPVLASLEAPAGPDRTVTITARWFDAARGARLAQRLNESPSSRSSGLNRAAVHVAELGVVFAAFPHDRRLPGLPKVVDEGYMAGWLARHVGQSFGKATVEDLEVRPVRYKPEGKCVVRLVVAWRGGGSCPPNVLYAKVSKPAIFERTMAVLPHLAAIGSASGFVIPRPLAVDSRLHLSVEREAPGRPMADALLDPDGPGIGSFVGAAIGRLHRCPIGLAARRTDADRANLLADDLAQLASSAPSRRAEIEAMGCEIERRIAAAPRSSDRCCHNDFHGGNILVGEAPALIDFEDAASGDPANDVASMCADLMALAAAHPAQREVIEAERRAFLDAYGPGDLQSLTAWTAMHCLLLAYQSLRYPDDRLPGRLDAMVDAADALLSGEAP